MTSEMGRAGGSAAHARLLKWLEECGTTISPAFGLRYLPGEGFGAVALADILEGSVLFSLPRELVLSLQTVSIAGLTDNERHSLGSGWVSLILAMMREKQSDSKWRPYLDTLPSTFDSLMFWSDDELDCLQASTVSDRIGKADAEKDYRDRIVPLVTARPDLFPNPSAYTLDLFHQMGSCILSRSFTVPPFANDAHELAESDDGSEEDDDGGAAEIAMVPLADALNAKSGADNAHLVYDSPTHLEMRATKDIPAGSQILNTYGDCPNSDLLRKYGHVDEVNPFDVVEISAELVADVAVHEDAELAAMVSAKIEWALDHGIDECVAKLGSVLFEPNDVESAFTLSLDDLIPDELVASAHLFRMPKPAFDEVAKKQKLRAPHAADDVDLIKILLDVIDKRDAQYSTSLEVSLELTSEKVVVSESSQEDDTLLGTDLAHRMRMAIIVRRGEKSLLRAAKEALQEMLATHAMPKKKIRLR